jgi:hypothetical protein
MPLLSYQNPKLEIRAEKSLLQAAQKVQRRGARKIDERRRTYSTLQRGD